MATTNIYEKPYRTKSRPKSDDVYVLILFKCDNTFIIKKKSNLHGITEDGLVTIKDQNKNYIGYCLCEGSLTEIEAAAERLDKEMNTDLESDCENIIDKHKLTQQQESNKHYSTSTTPKNSSTKINGPETIKSNNIQKKKHNDSTIRSLAMTSLDNMSKIYETPPISDKTIPQKDVQIITRKPALRDIQHLRKYGGDGESREALVSSEDDDYDDDEDNDSIEETTGIQDSLTSGARSKSTSINKVESKLPSKQSSSCTVKTKSHKMTSERLCSKKLFPSNTDTNQEIMVLLKSSILANKDLGKDLKQSLRDMNQLFVGVDKLDAKLNLIFENQKKIQRALARRKINVALHGGDFDIDDQSQTDVPFQHSLNYMRKDGTNIDLLQLYGVRTQLGRYVALVMDHIFTNEELCTITASQLIKDERYNIIKEAVRSRFKLNNEDLNIEWPTIHESILQKRRNEKKKRNHNNITINNNNPLPLQSTNNHKFIE